MSETITVAVLMPTLGRAEQMKRNVTGLLECDVPRGVELCIILAVCPDDKKTHRTAVKMTKDTRIFVVERENGSTSVVGWNEAARFAHFADWLVLGADDIVWHSDWLKEAMLVVDQTGAQVVGLHDGGPTDLSDYGAHYMVHRSFVDQHLDGYMVPPEYKSWWFDREICQRARAVGVYAPAWKALAEHCHPDWHKAPMDETYESAWHLHKQDKETYNRRMRELVNV
jgi:hypothetical protein